MMDRPRGIIVLEGADASGKTTLANYFREKYGARYLHSVIRRDIWRWHVGALDLAAKLADHELVVLDRHWLSELIYGTVFRGAPAYDTGARSLDRTLRKHGAVYVLCCPSDRPAQLKTHAERYAAGSEKFANIARVIDLYHDVAYGNEFRGEITGYLGTLIRKHWFARRDDALIYDYVQYSGKNGVRYFASRVIRHLEDVRETQLGSYLNYTAFNLNGRPRFSGIGTDTLFVGEQVSPTVKPGQPAWPFVWHDGLSAVSYLNAALQALDWDETRSMWTNARHWYGDPDDALNRTLRLYKWRRVVALGNVAMRAFSGVDELVHVPHPQFHRRFNHGPEEYAKIINAAISPVKEVV